MKPLMTNSVTVSPSNRWPAGARAACAFTFDLDAETLWMARDVNEPVTLSQGRFGVVEALPRILALLRGAEIHGTFFIPAWVAAHYPDAVRAIAGDGHEIGCHGDEHERVTDLGPAREKAILVKSLEVLTPLAGRRPIGYRAPAWQLSGDTLALLAGEHFDYSSNMMDRLVPYVHPPVGDRSLVEIPVSWILDDAPFFLFSGQRGMQPPGPVLQGWLTEFEGITASHGVTNFTFHPQLIGRPSRLACLRELIDHVRHTPRVWVAPLAEISAHWRKTGESTA
jgi:peptidoglycan/xylan/chitin deacetylase (PgdA/CDA1 family)